jgi:multimeric flavodoxin WrbA
MVSRVFAIHTSSHNPDVSSSAALTRAALNEFQHAFPGAEIRWLDAARLKIAPNLSCYANGKTHCGDPKSGKYRCWANFSSPTDEMPAIYDGLAWCDTFIFSTSNRWGTHSAVAQNVIERMNTLENRGSSLGEPYPLRGKRLGVIVSGLHWKTDFVATNLVDTLKWWGFATAGTESILSWQRSKNPFFEHPDNDEPYAEKWLRTEQGRNALARFVQSVANANKMAV